MPTEQEPVVVYISQGPLAAEVALAKLTSEGIPARLRYQAVGRALGLTVNGLGKVEVLVPPEFADEAEMVLDETAVGETAVDDTAVDDTAAGSEG